MNDSKLAFPDPGWIQGAFSNMLGMFDRVGLNKNFGKTVGMVFRLCQAAVKKFEATYEQRMTVTGTSYWERQCVRVLCSECREEMELWSLEVHL